MRDRKRGSGLYWLGPAGWVADAIIPKLWEYQKLPFMVLLREKFGRDALKTLGFWWTFPLLNLFIFWAFGIASAWSANFFWGLFYLLLFSGACIYQRFTRRLQGRNDYPGDSYLERFMPFNYIRVHRKDDPLYELVFPLGTTLAEFAIPFVFGLATLWLHNPIWGYFVWGGFVMLWENISEFRYVKSELKKLLDSTEDADDIGDYMRMIKKGKQGRK